MTIMTKKRGLALENQDFLYVIVGYEHWFGGLVFIAIWYNVNPGLINPKRLFNWEGTIKKYQIMTIGGVPP